LIPGSFKPPHAGHLAMVQQYAANHDEVLVLISRPLVKQRTLADGTVTATDAKKMWEILLGPVPNVDVQISCYAWL
jgi:cytidyltransferase-like protein